LLELVQHLVLFSDLAKRGKRRGGHAVIVGEGLNVVWVGERSLLRLVWVQLLMWSGGSEVVAGREIRT